MLGIPRQGNSSRTFIKSTESGQPCCRLARCLWNNGHHHSNISLNSFRARWCIDIAYGSKVDAAVLLQDWVQTVGSKAGLTKDNTRINSGSIGSPESRLELEVEFETLTDLETFWGSIPSDLHKAWSGKMADKIVNGSPKWEVFRTIEPFANKGPTQTQSEPALIVDELSAEEIKEYGESLDRDDLSNVGEVRSSSGLSIVEDQDDVQVVLDWKGEPMKINPNDKLPFRFD
eukprot:jgi/Picsp_1/5918/NSC_03275-R1_hypothetical protein COCSUDRAFT_53450 [Coccomyxa subellipsoidea C-169]